MTTEEVIKILESESCVDCTHISRSPIECPNTQCNVRQAILFAINALKIIDNAPTVEYPFYQEAYQTGYEEGKNERPQGEWVELPNKEGGVE